MSSFQYDILEYGTTVHDLAKMLKEEYGVAHVGVYVSHAVCPMNLRINPPSRFNFILQSIDEIYCYNLWSIDNDHEHQSNPKVKFKHLV